MSVYFCPLTRSNAGFIECSFCNYNSNLEYFFCQHPADKMDQPKKIKVEGEGCSNQYTMRNLPAPRISYQNTQLYHQSGSKMVYAQLMTVPLEFRWDFILFRKLRTCSLEKIIIIDTTADNECCKISRSHWWRRALLWMLLDVMSSPFRRVHVQWEKNYALLAELEMPPSHN